MTFSEGELIIRPSNLVRSLYFIESGFVRRYTHTLEGDEITHEIYAKQSCLYLPWLFSNDPVSNLYYFEALTKVVVWTASLTEISRMILADHQLMHELLAQSTQQTEALSSRLTTSLSGNSDTKLASLLLVLSNFCSAVGCDSTRLPIPLTQRLLSSMIGLSRELISTKMCKLKANGIVSYEKQYIHLLDLDRLRGLCEVDYLDR